MLAWGVVAELKTVWSAALSEADAEAYDGFVAAAAGGHYSQTCAWAKLASASTPFAVRYFLARRNGTPVGAALVLRTNVLVPLPFAQVERGPVVADPADLPEVLDALIAEARRHGVLRLSVMPYWSGDAKTHTEQILGQHGFCDVQTFAGRHVRSLRLDLDTLPADNLYAGGAFAQVRQKIRGAERHGATVRRGSREDIPAFRRLHEQLLHGKRLPSSAWYEALRSYFLQDEKRGAMFVCEFQGRVVSAVFAARHAETATYVVGASSGEDLRFSKMVLAFASAIRWAKENGCRIFDFGGIPMQGDVDAKRANIAQFKHRFSRTEIDFVHEHVRWF